MSFEVSVQGFRAGASRPVDPSIVRTLVEPFVIARDELHGFVRLRLADGDVDLYGTDGWTSLMFSRANGRAIFDLIVEIAARAELAILWPGGAAITSEPLRSELPPSLAGDAVVVARGAELWRAIERL